VFNIFKSEKVSEFPEEIKIERVEPSDNEILEEWVRVLHKNHLQFHSVNAIRVKDEEFPWYLCFGAGEFIREEPFVGYLNNAISNALLNVEGVNAAYHEDTEKYVIAGAPSGEELVLSASKAIDKFISTDGCIR